MSHTWARRTRRFWVAIGASAALILTGPYIGQLRGAIRTTLGTGLYVPFLNGVLLAAAAILLLALFSRRRSQAAWLCCGAGVLLVLAGAKLFEGANASQTAVERFHFIEYGAVTWLFYRAVSRGPWREGPDLSVVVLPIVYAVLVGVADEWLQWFVPERVGEWPDILLNLNAIVGGMLFSLGIEPPRGWRFGWQAGSLPSVLRAGSVLVIAVTAFLQAVHLGHAIDDPRTGLFTSRYTADELMTLARDRTARWKIAPPPTEIRRLSREDQYLAEAVWHVQARNGAWESAPRVSWHENLILERYFSPALDVPSYAMPASRWSPEQRRDAERRAGPAPGTHFDSHAARLRLYFWRAAGLWSIAGGIVVALLGIGRYLQSRTL